MASIPDPPPAARPALRQRLLARREQLAAGEGAADAAYTLTRHLGDLVAELEPRCLGVYVPVRGEFNVLLAVDPSLTASRPCCAWSLALPYCRREPREMHYRHWNGKPPAERDACGIPASDGSEVIPDVVLAPCVGYTPSGYRLGYGGGYFDRWLDAHPLAVAIGVAWSACEIGDAELAPHPHDQRLRFMITERGRISW